MKKYITLLIFSLLTFTGLSQDNGITYQAVIYNPNGQSLPGEDDGLSPLVETDICLKFSIMGNGLEYEETVQTTTDVFGMVNLKIGTNTQTGGSAGSLQDIDWDSGEKSMRVELNAVGNCNSFVQISYQTFSYVPFAYYALNEGNTSDISALEEALAENTAADAEESAAGDAADAALQEVIDANAAADAEESTAGDAADFALQAAIDANAAADAEESAAGTAADLAIQTLVEGLALETSTSITLIQDAIDANAAADAEESAAGDAADAALQAAIDANAAADAEESAAGDAADAALQDAIDANAAADAEESAAGDAADAALQDAIDANAAADAVESAAGDAADAALQDAIDANAAADAVESAAGDAADEALQAAIDAVEDAAVTQLSELSDVLVENNSLFVGNDPSATTNTAQANVSLGLTALDEITSGDRNTAVGHNALTEAKAGVNNVALGYNTLNNVTSGNYNVGIGNSAGSNVVGGSGNVFIGNNANTGSNQAGPANRIAIGSAANVTQNNTAVIGNDLVTGVYMNEEGKAMVYAKGITFGDNTSMETAAASAADTQAADQALQDAIDANAAADAVESAAGDAADAALQAAIDANAAAGDAADTALQAAIDANAAADAEESAAGDAADAALQDAIDANAAAADAADAALQDAIDANAAADAEESAAGDAADAALQDAIDANAAAADAADAALQDAIDANAAADAEESAAGDAADEALQAAIDANAAADAEESAAGDAADAALQDAIDANAAADAVESADGDAADQAILDSLDNLDLSVAGDNGVFNVDVYSGDNSPEETLLIIGTTDEVETDGSTDNQIQIGLPDNVVITGNLTVGGEISSPTIDDILATISELSEQINTLNEQVSALELLHVPVITLLGDANIVINQSDGVDYIDAGATAEDLNDGDITDQIVVAGSVDVNVAGSYQITYNVTDSDGNEATEVIREIEVVDDINPVIIIIGDNPTQHEQGTEYVDSGATASDNNDGDITENIQTENSVNSSVAGSYTVTYSVVDSSGNSHEAVRDVIVSDTTGPIITLIGDAEVSIGFGESYVDAGATATDVVDGDLTDSIVVVSNVDASSCGTYTVTYNVSDAAGNAATEVVRTVTVADDESPVVSLVGDSSVTIDYGAEYTEQGASVTDNLDEDVSVIISGTVDSMQSGTYVITYTATDACGNSTTVTRDVIVSLPVADDFEVFSGFANYSDEVPNQVYDVFSDPGFDFSWWNAWYYYDEINAYAGYDDDMNSGFDMTIPSPEVITQAPQSVTVTIYVSYLDGSFNYDTLQGQVNGGELGDSGVASYDAWSNGGPTTISFDIPVDASTWNADGQNNTITLHAFDIYLTWGGMGANYLEVSFNY